MLTLSSTRLVRSSTGKQDSTKQRARKAAGKVPAAITKAASSVKPAQTSLFTVEVLRQCSPLETTLLMRARKTVALSVATAATH